MLQSKGAITPVSWGYIPDPNAPWLNLKDNGDGTALLTGDPPVGTSGTFNPKIAPLAEGTLTLLNPFPVRVENTPVFTGPNTATFYAGKDSKFKIRVSQGNVTLVGVLPQGLTFISNGSVDPAVIFGTPAEGTGGQYTVNLVATAPGTEGPTTQQLTLNVNEAPRFTGPCLSPNCTVEVPPGGTFTVTTTGFPLMSSEPLPASAGPLPPELCCGPQWMSFSPFRLPPDFKASNRNAEGFATGTLTIRGTPPRGDYPVTITAQNGVGSPAQQTLTLKIGIPGDVNGDGVANCTDLDLVKASLNLTRGQTGYNPAIDLNNDGIINVDDLALVAENIPKGTVCH